MELFEMKIIGIGLLVGFGVLFFVYSTLQQNAADFNYTTRLKNANCTDSKSVINECSSYFTTNFCSKYYSIAALNCIK